MNREKIYFSIPAKAEFLIVIRLTTSAIGSKMNFDIDTLEDLKMAISEMSNIALSSVEIENLEFEYSLGDSDLEVILKKSEVKDREDEKLMMSKMIIEALMENVEFSKDFIKIKLYK